MQHCVSMYIGKAPVSLYTMKLGVPDFMCKMNFKNFRTVFSRIALLPSPHVSLPYKNIGFKILSNNSICRSIGSNKNRAVFFFN